MAKVSDLLFKINIEIDQVQKSFNCKSDQTVLEAAADANILSIGVDANQNYMHPGKVLTSMLKRVDLAVYNAFSEGENLTTGFNIMGLAEDGVGYAIDEHNESLVSAKMVAALESEKAKIVSGQIKVHDYMSDNSCPAK